MYILKKTYKILDYNKNVWLVMKHLQNTFLYSQNTKCKVTKKCFAKCLF